MPNEIDVSHLVTVGSEFAKPSDRAVMGDKRLVRMLPFGLGGNTEPLWLPAIWISPYEVFDEDLKEKVKIAILLLDKGPPKPEIVAVRIPSGAIEKFPTGPVEW